MMSGCYARVVTRTSGMLEAKPFSNISQKCQEEGNFYPTDQQRGCWKCYGKKQPLTVKHCLAISGITKSLVAKQKHCFQHPFSNISTKCQSNVRLTNFRFVSLSIRCRHKKQIFDTFDIPSGYQRYKNKSKICLRFVFIPLIS